MSKIARWIPTLFKVGILLAVLLLIDFSVIAFASAEIWSSMAYFFGQDVGTTMCTLMFVEGGVLLAFGSIWANTSVRNMRYGMFGKMHDSVSREDWQERREMIEKPNEVVVVSLLTGSVMMIASIVLFLA